MIIFAIITVISSNPCLILHNELALTKFETCFRDLVKWRQKWKLSLKTGTATERFWGLGTDDNCYLKRVSQEDGNLTPIEESRFARSR